MTGRKLPLLLLALALAAGTAALAREGNTNKDELRIFSDDIALQCTAVKDQLAAFNVKADPLTGYTLKDAVQSLCVCMPEKVKTLTDSLSPEELMREVGEVEASTLIRNGVINKCAAEQMQSMYGEACPKRFKKADLNARKYCACMKEVVSGYSEAETAEIADAASEYLPQAAEAEKHGRPAPPRPPMLETYYQADQNCKDIRKAFETSQP